MRARVTRQRLPDMDAAKPKLVVGGSRGRAAYGQAPDSVYTDQLPYDRSPSVSPRHGPQSPLGGIESPYAQQRPMGGQRQGLQTPEGENIGD